jgi:beta-carotene hydroxylase
MWVGFGCNSLIAYAFYTVHHDATHKAISGRNPRWLWLDTVCGDMAACSLKLEFRGYANNRLRHHARTNSTGDPDLLVKGPLWRAPMKWATLVVLSTVAALPMGERLVVPIILRLDPDSARPTSPRELASNARLRRFAQLGLVVLLVSVPFGAFWPALVLWWLPGWVGILILMVLFQWLPHFPFDRTDRFGATRVNRFIGSRWMVMQQDLHLIHHLYPSIPWYHYRAAFRELRAFLEANDAIIQGIDTWPHVPIQLRDTRPAA